MNKNTMIKNYRRFSGADAYIIGFIYKHQLYMIQVDEIMPRQMQVLHSSHKNGYQPKLQLVLNNKLKEQLIRKGAILLGSEELVTNGEYNNGVEFEKLISEMNGIEFRGKDNIGFWVGGDLEIDGKQIQVKFQGAQIVAEKTLKNLQKNKKWLDK